MPRPCPMTLGKRRPRVGLAVSRADVRGRGRAAALTPSPSRVAHGPIPACALAIVADLSTGSRACRRHPPATESRPRRVLPPACERPLCVHQTAICPRWLQCSRPSGCLEGPRASAPQLPFPIAKTGEEAAACPPTAVDTAVSLPLTRAGESVPSPLGKAAWCSPPPGGRGSAVCAPVSRRSRLALIG